MWPFSRFSKVDCLQSSVNQIYNEVAVLFKQTDELRKSISEASKSAERVKSGLEYEIECLTNEVDRLSLLVYDQAEYKTMVPGGFGSSGSHMKAEGYRLIGCTNKGSVEVWVKDKK